MIKINSSLLREWIFYCKENGFDKGIKKIGAKTIVDEEGFNQWIKESNGKPK